LRKGLRKALVKAGISPSDLHVEKAKRPIRLDRIDLEERSGS
jgi:hypothetical protein